MAWANRTKEIAGSGDRARSGCRATPARRGDMATIAAVTADGSRANLAEADIAGLRNALRGEVIQTGQDGYEAARRVWNGNVDRRPALVARCTGVADVQHAVAFAGAHRLLVSVRGGGHSAPGYGTNDGGLVIDLSPLKG